MRPGFLADKIAAGRGGRCMLKGVLETERVRAEAQADEGEAYSRKEGFFELRYVPSARRTTLLGIIGALAFFGIWEIGHYLIP